MPHSDFPHKLKIYQNVFHKTGCALCIEAQVHCPWSKYSYSQNGLQYFFIFRNQVSKRQASIIRQTATNVVIGTSSAATRGISGDYENYKQQTAGSVEQADPSRESVSSSSASSSTGSHTEVVVVEDSQKDGRGSLTQLNHQEKVKTTRRNWRSGAQARGELASYGVFSHRQ